MKYDKELYRIGEVAALLNLPATTIKYWTDTFPEVSPRRIGTGRQVKYRREDIEMLKLIKILMHDRMMQIEGAKNHLALYSAPPIIPECENPGDAAEFLRKAMYLMDDNPKALAYLSAVKKWVEGSSPKI